MANGMNNQNPFLDILQQGQQGGGQTGGMMSGGMMGGMQLPPPQLPPQPQGGVMPDVRQPGVTGDATKPLIQAAQALHQYIATSQDNNDIAAVRSIMGVLTSLIQRDQERASKMDERVMQQGQAPVEE